MSRRKRPPIAGSVILWEGPSELDGAPIVVIATGLGADSENSKTGRMVQTYIIRADMAPARAVRTGQDSSVCGDCRHRGRKGKGRTCYVNLGQGPRAVWNAYRAGRYRKATPAEVAEVGRGRLVRLGTYGDPAAAPAALWARLVAWAAGHTGYSHQWRTAADLRGLLMASVDDLGEHAEAVAAGWRTFRVSMLGEARTAGERPCPASKEAGARVTCADCQACDGTVTGRRHGVTIEPHGGFAVLATVQTLREKARAAR